MTRQRHSQRKYPFFVYSPQGFSLLEVVIAMLILTITSAGAFSLHLTSHKFLLNTRQRLQVVEEASGILEQLDKCIRADMDFPQDLAAAGEIQNPDQWGYETARDNNIDGQVVTIIKRWNGV